jgi:hypothetical protein
MWLAGGAPMPQVRAIASAVLRPLATAPEASVLSQLPAEDRPARLLLAEDVKRFLERPMEPLRAPTAFDAPPGAPIGGDTGMNWLVPPPWSCGWDDRIGDWRLQIED